MPFVAKRVFEWDPVEITDEWGIRDLKPGTAYALCNSVQCMDCGALFLDLRFSDKEMAALYADYRGQQYTKLRDHYEPGYAARNARLAEGFDYIPRVEDLLAAYVPPNPRVLDWGGDTGINTPFRKSCSLHHVYDISAAPMVSGARMVDGLTAQSSEYDLIVLSNVLEHVPYPADVLREVASFMNESTTLYIEVPHEDLVRLNPDAKNLHSRKKHWHEHINFFSDDALRALIGAAALRLLTMQSMEITVGGKNVHVYSLVCART